MEDDLGSATANIRRIASRIEIPQETVWGNRAWIRCVSVSYAKCPGSAAKWSFCTGRICHRLLHNQFFWTKISFTDEAFFNKGGITDIRNSYVWPYQEENLHANRETHFQTPSVGEHLVRYCQKATHRSVWTWRLLDRREIRTLLTGRAATAVRRCDSGSQTGGIAAARWPSCSFWWYCLSQSTFSRPLDMPGGPRLFGLRDYQTMDYFLWGHM
jgi:hypothetical protein